MAVVTLLTDFGTQDEYVGLLKGAILSVDPHAVIVDLCHAIAPQDVRAAAWMLRASFAFFPAGSIHLAIVDPGVGTHREIVAARCQGHILLAPNNGLLWPVLEACSSVPLRRVENQSLFRNPVSRTFHGRDIFAPVAGHLSQGMPFQQVGAELMHERLEVLDPQGHPSVTADGVQGTVVAIDRFGNLITNIGVNDLAALRSEKVSIVLAHHRINGFAETYAGNPLSEPVAVIGSRNCLEIAVNCGSAAERLGIGKGAPVMVRRG